MTAYDSRLYRDVEQLERLVAAACNSIAPSWPLDEAVAVNPFWGRVDKSFAETALTLSRLAGTDLYMPARYYLDMWQADQIRLPDLAAAVTEESPGWTVELLLEKARGAEAGDDGLPLLSDMADSERDLSRNPAFGEIALENISRFCASHFDDWQAEWPGSREHGLFDAWKAHFSSRAGVARVPGLQSLRTKARRLPDDPQESIAFVLAALNPVRGTEKDFLAALLLHVNGWASWCAYLRWEARRRGGEDQSIRDLLAIRLAWEWLLDDGERHENSRWHRWRRAWRASQPMEDIAVKRVWQRALEIAYQRSLVRVLRQPPRVPAVTTPEVQAVFCIDVRSERLRRVLESEHPAVQTLGFAGFFGVPIAYTPLGTKARRAQVPGLLAPSLEATDSTGDTARDRRLAQARARRLEVDRAMYPVTRQPVSGFALVEALGLGYVGKLAKQALRLGGRPRELDRLGLSSKEYAGLRPDLSEEDQGKADKVTLAEEILRAMSLTQGFAKLVLLVAHSSQSTNNAHASALDCGACGGHGGAVNARLLAQWLNAPEVRAGLRERGLEIPGSTLFLAALHNTTTDEVAILDRPEQTRTHHAEIERLERALRSAGEKARGERAPRLGCNAGADKPARLLAELRRRANDWSQTRPEWGLANNAAFVIAPRRRTREAALDGRVFLHEYDWRDDAGGQIIESIMTAPMIVTHWINMQYYASTVANRLYGSGNKVLHNVVGGNIGVFEGNGGDLRIGLPLQSVHDGESWVHTPLRLSVFIEAPRQLLEQVLEKHPLLSQLVSNQWMFLFRIDPDESVIEIREHDSWALRPWAMG